jgi:ribulose-phosphate 3-epimerase
MALATVALRVAWAPECQYSTLVITLLPSILAADFTALGDDLRQAAASGATVFHLDCMDAHFVPNLSFGPMVVEAVRRVLPDATLDVHLMMSDPEAYLNDFRQAGSDLIYIHVEAIGPRRISEAIANVRATGAQVGLAFNPDVDPMMWLEALATVDAAMLMTVYPGFGGQRFIPAVLPRLQALHAALPDLPLQVDGGINRETIPHVVAAGATRLVCGSAYFGLDAEARAALQRWAEAGSY